MAVISRIKEINIDSLPLHLAGLRWVSYVLFTAGTAAIPTAYNSINLILHGFPPPLVDMDFMLLAILCVFITFSNRNLFKTPILVDNIIGLPGICVFFSYFLYLNFVQSQEIKVLIFAIFSVLCVMVLFWRLLTSRLETNQNSSLRFVDGYSGPFALITFIILCIFGGPPGIIWFLLISCSLSSLLGGLIAFQLLNVKFGPAGETFSRWLNHLNARSPAPPSYLSIAAIDQRRGVILLISALCVAGFALAIAFTPYPGLNPILGLAVRLPIFVFSAISALLIALRSRSYFQISAASVLDVDRRAPILFLRSFEDDERPAWRSPLKDFAAAQFQLFDFSIETQLGDHFRRFGPFIAVGSPLDDVPQTGAARAKLRKDEWRGVLIDWMAAASTVVMLAGKTMSVTWELARLIEGHHLNKLILLLPSGPEITNARLREVSEVFSDTEWSAAFAEIDRPTTVRAITFGSNGALTLIRSNFLGREAHDLAALVAHDLILPESTVDLRAPTRGSLFPWRRRFLVGCLLLVLLGLAPAFVPGEFTILCQRSDVFCELVGESSQFGPQISTNYMELKIYWVDPGSTAEHIGLEAQDRILSYDGEKLHSSKQLIEMTAAGSAQGPRILIVRRGPHELKFEVPPGRLGISIKMVLRRRHESGDRFF
jgi:hypothetical protein